MSPFRMSMRQFCTATALYSVSFLLLSPAHANHAGLPGSPPSATGPMIVYGNPVAGAEEWTCPHGFGTIYITSQIAASAARRLGCHPHNGSAGVATRK